MQNIISVFLLACLWSSLSADNCKLDIGAGYRQDDFIWELEGFEGKPPVLSRLTWKDLRIFDVTACYKTITCKNIYVRAFGDYGRIFHGKNRDSDFRVNGDSVEEHMRFDNNGGHGDVWDLSSGIGYFFRTDIYPLRVAPLVGYSFHEQNLHMSDGYCSVFLDIPDFPGHHFKGLHSTYRARWHGPWTGVDIYFHCNDQITLTSSLEYHWLRFDARGHWNLRQDIAGDFHHSGYGHGFLGTFGADYNFLCGLYLGAFLSFNYFHLSNGKDSTPVFAEGNSNRRIILCEGKLKKVEWRSFSLIFTGGYHF